MAGPEPIAIVAATCRFPGARTPEELWQLARDGRTCFGPPPTGRWQEQTAFVGAFLEDALPSDGGKYGIAAAGASAIDPQQLLILTLVDEARAAGPSLETSEIGVFVGAGHPANIENVLSVVHGPCHKELLAGNLLSLISARVAYAYDLHGPVSTIDSACASSLVALHLACQALRADECEAAYVGGVHLNLTPLVHRLFAHAGALSPSGRLVPFGPDGDGMLPADGAGLVVLERLSRAHRLGHPVWASVLGSAVTNCGRTMGVMVPKPAQQIAVMRRALSLADVSANDVRFVEAHATGTRLGDAVERRSIAAVYPHGPRIGAIKGQIGHALTAAGMASLVRTIGELEPGELGAMNAFGFGGTNVHVVVRGEQEQRAGAPASRRAAPRRDPARDDAAAAGDDLDTWVFTVTRSADGDPILRPAPEGHDRLAEHGRYLITGASGGLGRAVAQFLAHTYRAKLVLTGRRTAGEETERWLAAIAADGGDAMYVPADLTDQVDVARLIGVTRDHLGELDGLFHLAGVLDGDALAVKRDGLLALRGLDPRLTVLFSSVAALFKSLTIGLEAYAEANAWLDQYAIAETAAGHHVVSIAWAPWTDIGMAAQQAEYYRRRGILPISPPLAVRAMRRAIAAGMPHVAVLHQGPSASGAQAPADRALAVPLDLRKDVHALIAKYGEIPAGQIRGSEHLMALGIDSLSAVDLVCELEGRVGRPIPSTFLFEHDTVDAVMAALERMMSNPGDLALPPASAGPHTPLPLLDTQQTFLVQQRYFPELPCNTFLACTVHTPDGGSLDRDVLALAVEAVVRHHPVLRSVVVRQDGTWWLRVGEAPPTLTWTEHLDDEAVANTVLDLDAGPLMRIVCDGRRLAVQAHHLLVDAWSAKIVVEALLTAYATLAGGGDIQPAASQPDWWSASQQLGQVRPSADADQFWRERLAGVPPLPLPWDGDPYAPPRGPARIQTLSLPAPVLRGLEDLAKRASVTLASVLLAGYARLLFDISGQHDVLVRVAHARRDVRVEGIGSIVGAFADSLPVRITVRPDEEPGALSRRVHADLVATRRHGHSTSSIALARFAERPSGGPSGLTPAGFSFVNLDASATIANLCIDEVCGASASGFTRLGLIGWTVGGQLGFSFNYLDSVFARATVTAIATRLERLLRRWASPRVSLEGARRLDGELVRACERYAARPLMPGLTFAELGRGSGALAAELGGGRIALLADPGPVATLGIVASLRAGATYVPLDPDWPDARVRAVLDEARPDRLLTSAGLADRGAGLAGGLPLTVLDPAVYAAGPPRAFAVPAGRGPAYITFTSGSTGRPKGVVVGQAAVLTLLDWATRMLGADAGDCFLQSSTLTFGASLRQTFAPILAGARAAPLPPRDKRDPNAVLDAVSHHRVTILNCVPSLWFLLMDAAERRGSAAALAALKWVLVGGEALPLAYWHRWHRLVPSGPRVANLYGGAETIANVTWFEVPRTFDSDEVYVPIGWPRFGMRVSRQESGELTVAGPIADGYLRATDQGFVPEAWGGNCYHTGDLTRVMADGALLFVGRRDQRAQIHGHRVELGEIEAALCQFPGASGARVDYGNSRLSAMLEVMAGPFPDPRTVRAFLAERLPPHMVPHQIDCTRRLERGATGKIVRPGPATTAVTDLAGANAGQPAQAARPGPPAPTSFLEAELGRIWQRLLRLDRLPGRDDDFFLLGGDSLLAIEMVCEAESLVGRRISPLVVHAHHRLSQLADVLGRADHGDAGPSRGPALDALGHDRPLGPVQRGFWFASRLANAQPVWTVRVPIRGPLDEEEFPAAVGWVQERHPILRTRFTGEAHRPVQRFGAGSAISVQFDDLSVLPGPLRDHALAQRHGEELAADIPLTGGPLLRVRLSRVTPDEHVLIVTGHHIVTDAHSAWVLLGELLEYCRRAGRGEKVAPPIPEIRYADVLDGPVPAPDPFWREYLGPSAGSTSGVQTGTPAGTGEGYAKVLIGSDAYARLRRAAAAAGTSPFGLVFAATARSLLQRLETRRLVLSTATDGRDGDRLAWADAVGPFAFGIPVVVRPGGDEAVIASLHEALAHAASAPASLPALLGAAGVAALGRYFISWLETPASAQLADNTLAPRWGEIDLRFRTDATATDVSIAALAHDGLTLHVRGRGDMNELAQRLERRLLDASRPRSTLIIYAPDGLTVPFSEPTLVESVHGAGGTTDVLLLPIHAGELGDHARVRTLLGRAIDQTTGEVVALAGMLPSLTGLAAEKLSTRNVVLTTGHAVTVVAMLMTIQRVLGVTRRDWSNARVGVLGFGAIGQATLQLCVARLGPPAELRIADPRFGAGIAALDGCDLILGAASVGRVLDVCRLAPGTVVVDDSFPGCFEEEQAWRRMDRDRDVLLVGGGMVDAGPLERVSPFPQADMLRARYPTRWLPGCHAEALLLTLRPDLGPTVGQVDVRRAQRIANAVDALGWQSAPLHLGARVIPDAWAEAIPRPNPGR